MYGSFLGNIVGFLYFAAFQLCGIIISDFALKKERLSIRLWLGSVNGIVLLQWLPAILSFPFGFTLSSHIAALVILLLCACACLYFGNKKPLARSPANVDKGTALAIVLSCAYALLVLHSFRLENGQVFSSQSTYGDMNMHLGFITSLKEQGLFPPEYSIFPGTLLSYPFLCDSISSSIYLFGSSLRFSYALPMIFAGSGLFFGLYFFFVKWLKSSKRASLAFVFFFLGGGLGFIYFIPESADNLSRFTRIFTGFYNTPTNFTDENLRFVNPIADMLLPQRATLFGWLVIVAAMYMLYSAIFEKKDSHLIYAAILIGALPMIHTHSFFAAGLICVMWLMMYLLKRLGWIRRAKIPFKIFLLCAAAVLYSVSHAAPALKASSWFPDILLYSAIFSFLLCLVFIFLLIIFYVKKFGIMPLLKSWGIFLIIVIFLAVPQLIFWTFRQTYVGESFIRGHFGWLTADDDYIWFYLKNIGLTGILSVLGISFASARNLAVISPAFLLWWISQLAVFQPNEYDNNKLILVAFMFLCGIASTFAIDCLKKIQNAPARRVISCLMVFLCTISAGLTLARESVSSYELYTQQDLAACGYIMENTQPSDVFLSGTQHNNAIASLTGRNIVCGSSAFLYFHGIDYYVRELDIKKMYESPADSMDLFELYGIDYVLLSPHERYYYDVDEVFFNKNFTIIYENMELKLYRLQEGV